MRSYIIHDLPEWCVTSWGNGLAYSIDHKPSGESVFFQGDAAGEFRDEFARLTDRMPELSYADALSVIFQDREAFA